MVVVIRVNTVKSVPPVKFKYTENEGKIEVYAQEERECPPKVFMLGIPRPSKISFKPTKFNLPKAQNQEQP